MTLANAISKTLTVFLLTAAFLISAIRHSFWLCLIIPVRGLFRFVMTQNKLTLLVSAAASFVVLYQPFINLPNGGFLGSMERLEASTDVLRRHAFVKNDRSEFAMAKYYLQNVPVTDNENAGGQIGSGSYDFWRHPKDADVAVRPSGSSVEDKKVYFDSKGVATTERYVHLVYNPDKMKQIFPYEPKQNDPSSFKFMTNTLQGYFQEGSFPFIKHFIIVLIAYAGITWALSKIFTFWLVRVANK